MENWWLVVLEGGFWCSFYRGPEKHIRFEHIRNFGAILSAATVGGDGHNTGPGKIQGKRKDPASSTKGILSLSRIL